MLSRRQFIGWIGGTLPAVAWCRPQGTLRAIDAGSVRVYSGPWTALPATKSGVHLENLHLRMPDGVRLNAFLYLPEGLSDTRKVPALLNTTPHRNMPREDSLEARSGFASIFVDVRGTGGSIGIPKDEYSAEEHEDAAHVIDWVSKQPWCNGIVGMCGASYSAFNSLWVAAALKPLALKAIYILGGTDNRYTDDIHYPGDAMLMSDNSWALRMLTSNAMPGAPDSTFAPKPHSRGGKPRPGSKASSTVKWTRITGGTALSRLATSGSPSPRFSLEATSTSTRTSCLAS